MVFFGIVGRYWANIGMRGNKTSTGDFSQGFFPFVQFMQYSCYKCGKVFHIHCFLWRIAVETNPIGKAVGFVRGEIVIQQPTVQFVRLFWIIYSDNRATPRLFLEEGSSWNVPYLLEWRRTDNCALKRGSGRKGRLKTNSATMQMSKNCLESSYWSRVTMSLCLLEYLQFATSMLGWGATVSVRLTFATEGGVLGLWVVPFPLCCAVSGAD